MLPFNIAATESSGAIFFELLFLFQFGAELKGKIKTFRGVIITPTYLPYPPTTSISKKQKKKDQDARGDIEPGPFAWEAKILPLDQLDGQCPIREFRRVNLTGGNFGL